MNHEVHEALAQKHAEEEKLERKGKAIWLARARSISSMRDALVCDS